MNGHTALFEAAELGFTDCVQVLAEGGANVEAEISGDTALMVAATEGR